MPRDLDDPGWVRVQERLAEALAPFASDFGARECIHGNWGDCEENDGDGCPFDETQPKKDSMPVIQHFALIVSTTDMNAPSGTRSDMVAIDAPNQPGYVTHGMYFEGLHG